MATGKKKRSKAEPKRKISRASAKTKLRSAANEYEFKGGFPTARTTQRAYDDADLNRAIDAYKFFYPTVVGAAIIKGNESVGLVTNKVFGIMDSNPKQVVFTTNADTPYGPLQLDLSIGPIVIELPPGPLIVCSIDINQRWVADMGLPGPDAGKGAKHLLVGPDHKDDLPAEGYYVHRASSNRQIVGVRSLPVNGDRARRQGSTHDHQDIPAGSQDPVDGAEMAGHHRQGARRHADSVRGQVQILGGFKGDA
jgi:hypothetical protein